MWHCSDSSSAEAVWDPAATDAVDEEAVTDDIGGPVVTDALMAFLVEWWRFRWILSVEF